MPTKEEDEEALYKAVAYEHEEEVIRLLKKGVNAAGYRNIHVSEPHVILFV